MARHSDAAMVWLVGFNHGIMVDWVVLGMAIAASECRATFFGLFGFEVWLIGLCSVWLSRHQNAAPLFLDPL